MIDEYRRAVDDPDGAFPTIAVKHDATALGLAYEDNTGGVNAGNEIEFHNPPVAGKKIRVTGRIHDKYSRRDKPYLVIEATATDEDGRLIERMRTYQMKKPDEVGKKWHPQV
jgi:acyl dehydratase